MEEAIHYKPVTSDCAVEEKYADHAIAVYGERQTGTTYLIGRLLDDCRKPFSVTDSSGREYNFWKDIHPITSLNREQFSTIIRYSSYNNSKASHFCSQYPVMIRLLSVSDIVVILTECYYMNNRDARRDGLNLSEIGKRLCSRYKDLPLLVNALLNENDIIEIERSLGQSDITSVFVYTNNLFFKNIASIIRRVPQTEWDKVFCPFWNDNKALSELFRLLTSTLARLDYTSEAYLSLDSLSRFRDAENSILSSECIFNLFQKDTDSPITMTDVYFRHNGQNNSSFNSVSIHNSELSAICKEVVFKINEEYINGTTSKEFLRKCDVLDFPKAQVQPFDMKLEDDNDVIMSFAREKVYYLFWKYVKEYKFNILLFCHNSCKPQVPYLCSEIAEWVRRVVGDTPDCRKATITRLNGCSPLFVISTEFRLDATPYFYNMNSSEQFEWIWENRFYDVLYKECLRGDVKGWVDNWTDEESFKNFYILRYLNKQESLFQDGFSTLNNDYEVVGNNLSPHLYKLLHDSFVNSKTVSRFFDNPEETWNCGATFNNDGSDLIIERLNAIAHTIE